MPVNRLPSRGVLGLVTVLLAVPAVAGQFSVTPVRIFMAPQDRAAAVTVVNEGDDELVMQADVFVWRQQADGAEELTLSEDLFLSPPILKLAPRSRQVVRLAMLRPPQPARQLTYRMIVREIPEARPAEKGVELKVALAFSLPVFVTPPGARHALDCRVRRQADATLAAVCGNAGTAYVQPHAFRLTDAHGTTVASRDSGGYILPDIARAFALDGAADAIPAGTATLAVQLDDGSTRSFEVTLPE